MINIKDMNKIELKEFIANNTDAVNKDLRMEARKICDNMFGNKIYLRGLIEISSYCKNGCYYCISSSDNKNAKRYRLSESEILACCKKGHELGLSTFVLQAGEDAFLSSEEICRIISKIRTKYPESVIALSLGEKDKETYKDYFFAGADRYFLRYDTANEEHYKKLHPDSRSLTKRKQCLYDLKEIGFQVGTGFMAGSPFQTSESLAEDILFLKELQPHIVGLIPFLPYVDTKSESKSNLALTLNMISMVRMLLNDSLILATTALGIIHKNGLELGIKHGANVLAPDITSLEIREKLAIHNEETCVKEEPEEYINHLKSRITNAGFVFDLSRGDHPSF